MMKMVSKATNADKEEAREKITRMLTHLAIISRLAVDEKGLTWEDIEELISVEGDKQFKKYKEMRPDQLMIAMLMEMMGTGASLEDVLKEVDD